MNSGSGPSYEINWSTERYERTYAWRLEKTGHVDELTLGQNAATADLEYSVSAIPDGYSDANRVMTTRATFDNNLVPKTIRPQAYMWVGDVGITCSSEVMLGASSFVGPNGTRQIRSTCEIPDHLDSDDISVSAWVEWGSFLLPDGRAGDTNADDFTAYPDEEKHKSIEVVDNKTEPGQEHTLGTAQWNSSGTPVVFDYTVEKTGLDMGHCTSIDNEARIKGLPVTATSELQVCPDAELTIERTINATFDREYGWGLSKSGSVDEIVTDDDAAAANLDYVVTAIPNGYVDGNVEVNGRISVHNPNTRGAKRVTVGSTLDLDGTTEYCDITYHDGSSPHNVHVGFGGTAVFNYTCDLGDSVPANATHTANVIWDEGSEDEGETSATSDVTFHLDETENEQVQVYDDKTVQGEQNFIGSANWHDGETEFTYSLTRDDLTVGECTGVTNNAWIDSVEAADSSTLDICPEADLVIEKTVDATVDRVYQWDLTKSGDVSELAVDEDGASATLEYTVKATPSGFEDMDPRVSGEIEVKNPNTFGEPILATVTDTLDTGAAEVSCEVTAAGGPATDIAVAPEESVVFDYTCEVGESLPDTITNTAVVTWGEDDSATTTVEADVEVDAELHRTVSVLDDKASSGQEHDLGVATWNEDGKSTVFDYALTRDDLAVGECTEVTNNAWIASADVGDSTTLEICPEKETPTPAPTEDPTGGGSDPDEPGTSDGPGGTASDSLPALGASVGMTALAALVLAMIGAGFVAITRRGKA